MDGLTSAINRFLNSENGRMARRTDYNTGECRMKDTSASCFHYPSRFRREWASVSDVLDASIQAEETKLSVDDMFVDAADVTVIVNGVEYSLTIKS